jgi:hypothetical protein
MPAADRPPVKAERHQALNRKSNNTAGDPGDPRRRIPRGDAKTYAAIPAPGSGAGMARRVQPTPLGSARTEAATADLRLRIDPAIQNFATRADRQNGEAECTTGARSRA